MVPGVGFYYGGIIQRKNYLSILSTSGLALAIVSFQWFFWGYSISFSEHGSDFIGDLHNFALKEVSSAAHPAAPSIPEMTYVFIQGMFACITPVLAFGSAAERTRVIHCLFCSLYTVPVFRAFYQGLGIYFGDLFIGRIFSIYERNIFYEMISIINKLISVIPY